MKWRSQSAASSSASVALFAVLPLPLSACPFDALDFSFGGERAEVSTGAESSLALLHEFFTDDGTRISKGADRAVGKYMETFVREAIARAAFERQGEDVRVGGWVYGGTCDFYWI